MQFFFSIFCLSCNPLKNLHPDEAFFDPKFSAEQAIAGGVMGWFPFSVTPFLLFACKDRWVQDRAENEPTEVKPVLMWPWAIPHPRQFSQRFTREFGWERKAKFIVTSGRKTSLAAALSSYLVRRHLQGFANSSPLAGPWEGTLCPARSHFQIHSPGVTLSNPFFPLLAVP